MSLDYDIKRLSDLQEQMLLIMTECIAKGDIEYYWMGYKRLKEVIEEKFNVYAEIKTIREEMKYLKEDGLVDFAPAFDLETMKFSGSGYFLREKGEYAVDLIREKNNAL